MVDFHQRLARLEQSEQKWSATHTDDLHGFHGSSVGSFFLHLDLDIGGKWTIQTASGDLVTTFCPPAPDAW